MPKQRHPWFFALISLCVLIAAPINTAAGSTPEGGLYWDPGRPAQAYFIEHQGDQVVFVAMAYNHDGQPEWFTASGPLNDDFIRLGSPGHEDADAAHLEAPLFRLSGGPPLDFGDTLPGAAVPYFSASPVGWVIVEFYGSGRTYMLLNYNGASVTGELVRFNFGLGGFGQVVRRPHQSCWPNISGEWVFVDTQDLAQPARRFKFAEPQVRAWNRALQPATEMHCGPGDQVHDIEYRDRLSGAVLRCRQTQVDSGSIGIESDSFGCNLIEDNQAVFSFEGIYPQLDRIRAWRGALVDQGERLATDADGPQLTGFRVR